MKKVFPIIAIIATLLLSVTLAHKAENRDDQYKVDESSMTEQQIERRDKARQDIKDRFKIWEEYETEKDPVKRAKLYVERHAVELVVIIAISASTLNFLAGRSLNAKLAFKWLETVEKPLIDGFTYCPEDCKGDDGTGIKTFDNFTSREYPIALSGRETCKYASFNFVTKPRHDIATTLLTTMPFINRLFTAQRDILWIDIPIERGT